jgi:hypothetical protein
MESRRSLTPVAEVQRRWLLFSRATSYLRANCAKSVGARSQSESSNPRRVMKTQSPTTLVLPLSSRGLGSDCPDVGTI